jgi:putative Mn2+ efflux pump MntP
MQPVKMCGIAGIFAGFQALMPLIGWICIHTVVQYFNAFEILIPWIALALLSFIGIKMILDSIHDNDSAEESPRVGIAALLLQGIATSIDALSVGFTIAEYDLSMALACAGIIAAVTFAICMAGLAIGKKAGTRLAGKAGILGGIILIVIGLEIFISSFL